jgi:glycosyltransferase involved in cell wall biosynthesis
MGGMTSAEDLGELTISMLRGEEGRQAKEVERLVKWLASHENPDIIHISNALLLGMARRIKEELNIPVVCSLQDEDIWIDALPEPQRRISWEIVRERSEDIDAFISVSNYYKDMICERLEIPCEKIHVIHSGIDLEGYRQSSLPNDPPVIGFLERQCREKGLDILLDAFIILKKSGNVKNLKLKAAGGKLVEDDQFLKDMRHQIAEAGFAEDVELLPNLNYQDRLAFLQSLSVLSVPAEHREAFGIYIIEALASGVPVVQPNRGAFPEILEATGGGIIYEPNDAETLAYALETLLLDPKRARELGSQGKQAVLEKFGVDRMAGEVTELFQRMMDNKEGG